MTAMLNGHPGSHTDDLMPLGLKAVSTDTAEGLGSALRILQLGNRHVIRVEVGHSPSHFLK